MNADGNVHAKHTMKLADLDDVDRGLGSWWLCSQPERPFDKDGLGEWECDGCVIALAAAAKSDRGHLPGLSITGDGVRYDTTIAGMLADANTYRRTIGLRTFGADRFSA